MANHLAPNTIKVPWPAAVHLLGRVVEGMLSPLMAKGKLRSFWADVVRWLTDWVGLDGTLLGYEAHVGTGKEPLFLTGDYELGPFPKWQLEGMRSVGTRAINRHVKIFQQKTHEDWPKAEVLFPAGQSFPSITHEFGTADQEGLAQEKEWSQGAAYFSKMTHAPNVPVYIGFDFKWRHLLIPRPMVTIAFGPSIAPPKSKEERQRTVEQAKEAVWQLYLNHGKRHGGKTRT